MQKNAIKISEYPFIKVNTTHWTGRIESDAFVLGYAKENYGAKFVQKNYQIPLSTLRSDLMRFVGIQNIRPSYRNNIQIWNGIWNDTRKAVSYVYEWDISENGNPDYIYDKHGKVIQSDDVATSKLFVLNQAPLPMEQTSHLYGDSLYGDDPNPNTIKIIDKAYVDGRFDGWRIVSNSIDDTETYDESNLHLRSYTCLYYLDKLIPEDSEGYRTLNFVNNTTDQRGDLSYTIGEKQKHLTFFVRVKKFDEYWTPVEKGGHECKLRFTVDNEPVEWTYEDELGEIMRQETLKEHFNLKFHVEWRDGRLHLLGGAMFGRNQANPILKELSFEYDEDDDDSTRNIPLVKYRGRSFISQYYDFEQVNEMTDEGAVQTISFDVSGFENEQEYKWNYYLLTPYWYDTVEGSRESWGQNVEQNIRFGEEIQWVGHELCDEHPRLQPNRLYCLEFTRLLDGFLIGRVAWSVSLVKKNEIS